MVQDNQNTPQDQSVLPSQYQQLVVQTTDRILLIVLGLTVYSVTSNLYFSAMRMVTTGLVAFALFLLALWLHRSGRHTVAQVLLLGTLNLAIFTGSFFLPTSSNLSMFLLTFVGLPFMMMSRQENPTMMGAFCALPLILWITLIVSNYGDGQFIEVRPEVAQVYGYSHSIMVFAMIALQFFHYDRIRRSYAQALRGALAAQKQANAGKTAFLRSMSHEMRTPLGAILGAADLLRSAEGGKRDIEALATIIMTSGQDMLSLSDKSTSFRPCHCRRPSPRGRADRHDRPVGPCSVTVSGQDR